MNIKNKKSINKNEEAVDLEKEIINPNQDLSEDQVPICETFEGSEEANQTEIKKEDLNYDLIIKELTESNKNLYEENTKLTNELNAYKDRLLKNVAEYDNFRKRTAKEKEEIYNGACEDILKNIFPILDNIERAAAIDGAAEDIKKGLEMTLKQFNESLSKLQVEVIDATGEFDPNLHNAVMHFEDESLEKNKVVEVFQKGFKRGNKILRHSMVKVVN